MGAFLLFLLVLILIIIFLALSLVGSIVGGILNFFGIKTNKRRNYSNRSDENFKQNHQSKEGARRMHKFKNTAEDTDYEVIDN
jgi:hypothetical protein